jgi:hypothetical protein
MRIPLGIRLGGGPEPPRFARDGRGLADARRWSPSPLGGRGAGAARRSGAPAPSHAPPAIALLRCSAHGLCLIGSPFENGSQP